MKAVAVTLGEAGSIHLEDVPKPSVDGLERYDELIRALTEDGEAIKVYVEVGR